MASCRTGGLESVKKSWCRNVGRSEEGTYTIEASLIFPILFLLTVAVLFGAILIADKSSTYIAASVTADRISFVWDNSFKNSITGGNGADLHDSLYWRTLNDDVLDVLPFAFMPSTVTESGKHDTDEISGSSSLPQKKLSGAFRFLPNMIRGTMDYTNHWLARSVSAELRYDLLMPAIFAPFHLNGGTIDTEVKSSVVEPVEWIRNINLARTYVPYVKQFFQSKQEVNQVITDFQQKLGKSGDSVEDAKLAFSSHSEAKLYLQKLVGGKERHISTPEEGTWRMIDAMDADHIAHQAYFGAKDVTTDMKQQMDKDAVMLRKGQVSGVVWHFFRREKDGAIGPSPALKKLLESKGIVIVIHD